MSSRKAGSLALAVLLTLFGSLSVSRASNNTSAESQPPPGTCTIQRSFLNDDRHVPGPVFAECAGDPINCFPPAEHSIPWGNWGVDSPLGGRTDSNQFWGYEYIDGNYQWDSCTTVFQSSDRGAQQYGWYEGRISDEYACHPGMSGLLFTFTGQYMDRNSASPRGQRKRDIV